MTDEEYRQNKKDALTLLESATEEMQILFEQRYGKENYANEIYYIKRRNELKVILHRIRKIIAKADDLL